MVHKLDIDDFLSAATGHTIVDVRAPAEFNHGHIPGAVSLPLFSDEERTIIGTLYKQKGREAAMMKGLEFYGPNMQQIIHALQATIEQKKLFIHCWRGGMRSSVVAWMLDLFGYHVTTLQKGYKAFRAKVLSSFDQPANPLILGGKTGSAKTLNLHQIMLQNQQVIDLEGLAAHKGSAFGSLGESIAPTQEQFENDLFWKLRDMDNSSPLWLEDESQRIGLVNIPNPLWRQMQNAPVIYLEIPFEERLSYLVATYGKFETEELKNATLRIQKRLGGLETANVLHHLDQKDFYSAFAILLRYYDKTYERATAKRNPSQIHKIESDTVDPLVNADLILKAAKSLMTKTAAHQ